MNEDQAKKELDLYEKLIKLPDKVNLGQVFETLFGIMFILNQENIIFPNCKKDNTQEYNDGFNTIISGFITNLLNLAGYTEAEIRKIADQLGVDLIEYGEKLGNA